MRVKKQNGFSLVEAIIVVVIMGFVILTFGSLALKLFKTSSQLEERSVQNKQRKNSGDVLRDDFEAVGQGLTLSQDEVLSGNIQPPFAPNSAYQVSLNGDITSIGNGSFLVSDLKWQGNGSWGIQLNSNQGYSQSSYRLRLANASNTSDYREIYFQPNSLYLIENGQTVFQNTVQSPSMWLSIRQEKVVSGQSETCRLVYVKSVNNTDSIIYQSQTGCFASWIISSVSLPQSSTLSANSYQLESGAMVSTTNTEPVKLPLFPNYRNTRLTSPVFTVDSANFGLLSSDSASVPLYLSANSALTSGSLSLSVRVPENRTVSLSMGDVVFISDFWHKRSALLRLTENFTSSASNLLKTEVISSPNSTDLFQGWSSDISDYSGFTFPAGTKIVKLNPPAYYRVDPNSQGSSTLFRREGNEAWSVVIPALENFSLASELNSNSIWKVSYNVKGESVENPNAESLSVRLTFAPRSLNRTPEAY